MILKLVMVAAALIAVVLAIMHKDLTPRLIVVNLLAGICLVAFGDSTLATVGMIIYCAGLLIALLHGLIGKKLDVKDKLLFVLLTLPILLAHIFKSMHWPFAGILTLVSIISLFAFVYMLTTNRSKYKSELGFMIVVVTDVIITSGITISAILTH